MNTGVKHFCFVGPSMDKRELWEEYERLKKLIIATNPTPEEYTRMIRELCKRLGI